MHELESTEVHHMMKRNSVIPAFCTVGVIPYRVLHCHLECYVSKDVVNNHGNDHEKLEEIKNNSIIRLQKET